MDADPVSDVSVSVDDIDTDCSELGSCKVDSLVGAMFSGEINGELGRAGEVLTRIELDVACTSEKFYNLNILMMHVATEESEFEVLDLERCQKMPSSFEKGLGMRYLVWVFGFRGERIGMISSPLFKKRLRESHKWISCPKT
ncbi:hypothetical protein EUGRSUZ_J01428 [Eucalyptus grandis]|uniref:Uncharacterized protein n=2 Tax=Eucalyptus grandis TaxID=71139 RepID=A0ACC3J5K6_EUCGR|nr:hypothetical protein EUGRSUZ_J01428 [Eucalyptus grandis]